MTQKLKKIPYAENANSKVYLFLKNAKFYFKILLENKNLNNKVLEKFYKKYGKKPIKVNKYRVPKTTG